MEHPSIMKLSVLILTIVVLFLGEAHLQPRVPPSFGK
ncbi:uncharacterized protein LOC113564291 [Drosophila erecta]|nr:uncharacterized protein LOC113564291 [Drosophila erecta]